MKASTNKQTKTKRTKLLSADPDPKTNTTNLRSKSYQALANKTQYNDRNNHRAYKTPIKVKSFWWYCSPMQGFCHCLFFFLLVMSTVKKTINIFEEMKDQSCLLEFPKYTTKAISKTCNITFKNTWYFKLNYQSPTT